MKKSNNGKIKDINVTFFLAFPKWFIFLIYFYQELDFKELISLYMATHRLI